MIEVGLKDGITQHELVMAVGNVSKTMVSKYVTSLQDKWGLVSKTPVADGRRTGVYLTDKGKQLVKTLTEV